MYQLGDKFIGAIFVKLFHWKPTSVNVRCYFVVYEVRSEFGV